VLNFIRTSGLSTASGVNKEANSSISINSLAVRECFLPQFGYLPFLPVSLQGSGGFVAHLEDTQAVPCNANTQLFCQALDVQTSRAYFDASQSESHKGELSVGIYFTYSFDYTTSDDAEAAGNRSDVFLIPSLDIWLAKSAHISLNKTTCSGGYEEIRTWSLDSVSTVPVRDLLISILVSTRSFFFKAFAWRSVEDVQAVIIPFLKESVNKEKAIINDASNTNITAKDLSARALAKLVEAIEGWQKVLDRNSKMYEKARAGELAANALTGVVAEGLLTDANGKDNVKNIDGSLAPNADALREISAIR
jgi:hypothetical protein